MDKMLWVSAWKIATKLKEHVLLQIGIWNSIREASCSSITQNDKRISSFLNHHYLKMSLTMQLKIWVRQDLEHLNMKKIYEFINKKLLSNWSNEQLCNDKIWYPVSNFIVSRWMKEAGFKYEANKKWYYVDRHKYEDVVSDRVTYLDLLFFKWNLWALLDPDADMKVSSLKV